MHHQPASQRLSHARRDLVASKLRRALVASSKRGRALVASSKLGRALVASSLVVAVATACLPADTPPPVAREVPSAVPARLGIGGCPVHPSDHAFAADVRRTPVRADSAAVINSVGGALSFRAGFGSLIWEGSRPGVPVNVVDSRSAAKVAFRYGMLGSPEKDTVHPMPVAPKFEGAPGIAWDRHLVIVDTATCTSHEFFFVTPPWLNVLGLWIATTGTVIDLRSNVIPPNGTANGSGTSMLSGLVRYEEVAAGRVDHAVGINLPKVKLAPPIWPANRTDGRSDDPSAPEMGTWFRLRPEADLSTLGPQARIIAEAMKVHGAVLSDTGVHSGAAIGGSPSEHWNDADLSTLSRLTLGDFEVIDGESFRKQAGSYEIR